MEIQTGAWGTGLQLVCMADPFCHGLGQRGVLSVGESLEEVGGAGQVIGA